MKRASGNASTAIIATGVASCKSATLDGKLRPGSKTEAFVKAVKVPVHVPLSGKTMEFDAGGKCTSGC